MKVTISTLNDLKRQKKRFSVVSCYDYTSAAICVKAGTDVLLAGDSAAQFVLGYDNTLGISMDFMIAITAGVRKAGPDSLLVADMPYAGCVNGRHATVENAKRFITECNADIVKIEAAESDFDTIKAIIDSGIPCMPHLGIRPQTGKYKAEGTTAEIGVKIIELAEKSFELGAQMLLLEGTAREVAKIITDKLPIPVISCGAGPDCDGQVLVLPDILNLKEGMIPKFAKHFGNVGQATFDALALYNSQIKQGVFPDDEHSYHMKTGEYEKLKDLIK